MKKVFIFKENTDDRDCVKYIQIDRIGKLECGHYFPEINLEGACFSCGFRLEQIDFDNITTILTAEDFESLDKYNKSIQELGCSITEQDERYLKGMELYRNIRPILDKLTSKENADLFLKVQQEEKEYLMEEFSLDEDEADFVFNNYGLDYRDRGIVATIFDDIEEAAREEAESLGYVDKHTERYFNYETFGTDLLDGEYYVEMPDERVIRYMY